jgi:hypothetical protein
MFNFDDYDDRVQYTVRELNSLGQRRAAAYYNSEAQMQQMRDNQGEDYLDEIFEIGTFVKRVNHTKRSLGYKFTGPYIVTERLENSLYRLMLPNGDPLKVPVHQDDLRHYDSKDLSNFYYNNHMNSAHGGVQAERGSLSREGGVVTDCPTP